MKLLSLVLILIGSISCQSQTHSKMTENKTNPLLCDPETGSCEIPAATTQAQSVVLPIDSKPVKIIYYTDPICSSCWGIEPQLRKLKLEYGSYFDIDYRMGGLLPDWSYNSGGISKPSDVAHHWHDASLYYQMPIDGDVWLEDPLDSSYPSCIAVKAAQIQDRNKAVAFMRILREKLYLEKLNIAKWDNIVVCAQLAGLDTQKLKQDYDTDAKKHFQDDLQLARQLGVRGFPTLFFADGDGNKLTVYGSKPYASYENALLALYPEAKKKKIVSNSPLALFDHYPTLTVREYAELLDIPVSQATAILEKQTTEGYLSKKVIKTGALYLKK